VATITLNRPASRNALNGDVRRRLPALVAELDADDAVDVLILTGADPAFCAGFDLKELGAGVTDLTTPEGQRGPFPDRTKPLIGAVNGVAVTGGLEVALACDFLIASDRARFADTHARVGIQPGWGLVFAAVPGRRRAPGRQMSMTGNYVDAATALAWDSSTRSSRTTSCSRVPEARRRHRLERPAGGPAAPADVRGGRGHHRRRRLGDRDRGGRRVGPGRGRSRRDRPAARSHRRARPRPAVIGGSRPRCRQRSPAHGARIPDAGPHGSANRLDSPGARRVAGQPASTGAVIPATSSVMMASTVVGPSTAETDVPA